MFKKDREIWNLKEQVSRQENYIEDLEVLKNTYKRTARERRETIDEQDKIIKEQKDLINEFVKELYSNIKTDKQKVDKLKEVIRRQTK